MSDERLREAERRWRETGDIIDETEYLCRLLRTGGIPIERLRLAAFLQHAASGEVVRFATEKPATPADSSDLRGYRDVATKLGEAVQPCGREGWARLGLALGRRNLPVWLGAVSELQEPDRAAPLRLLVAVREWLVRDGGTARIAAELEAVRAAKERALDDGDGPAEDSTPVQALDTMMYAGELVLIPDDTQRPMNVSASLWNVLFSSMLGLGLGQAPGAPRLMTSLATGAHRTLMGATEDMLPWALGRHDPVGAGNYLAIEGASTP